MSEPIIVSGNASPELPSDAPVVSAAVPTWTPALQGGVPAYAAAPNFIPQDGEPVFDGTTGALYQYRDGDWRECGPTAEKDAEIARLKGELEAAVAAVHDLTHESTAYQRGKVDGAAAMRERAAVKAENSRAPVRNLIGNIVGHNLSLPDEIAAAIRALPLD